MFSLEILFYDIGMVLYNFKIKFYDVKFIDTVILAATCLKPVAAIMCTGTFRQSEVM